MANKGSRTATGMVALSAVVLATSAASAAVRAAPAPVPESAPARGAPGADGGTVPVVEFPSVESHLASGRFVGAVPPSATGSVPASVLAAYQRATERTNLVQPNCHIPLELVAAIGKVESGHARGGRVDAAGRTLSPILGPVLNGGAFAAIADTDGGRLDGDQSWDRAVGPMQFIPGTWARWGSDGDADGSPDPHNVFDASLAAARYLCAANRDLGTPAGLDEAVLSYNHSTSYLSLVRSWMSVYRNGTVSVSVSASASVSASVSAEDPVAPSATPPVTTPPPSPPPTTPPTTPPPTPPSTPPTTPPSTPPPPEGESPDPEPPTEEPTDEEPPAAGPPAAEPADECGLLDAVGDLVGGLLGEAPECVHLLELSTPAPATPTPPAADGLTSDGRPMP